MLQYKQILKVTVSKYNIVRLGLIPTLKNDKITHTYTVHMCVLQHDRGVLVACERICRRAEKDRKYK